MKKAFWAILLAASVSPALAQDKLVNMKVSIWLPPAHPLVPATNAWPDDLEEASGGSTKMTIFRRSSLERLKGYQPGRFPIAADIQLPFVVGDGKKGTLAVDSWNRKYAKTEMTDTYQCFAFIQDPGTFDGRKNIVLSSDLKSVKVRPAASTIVEIAKTILSFALCLRYTFQLPQKGARLEVSFQRTIGSGTRIADNTADS
jgi:hypothetical protein